LVQMILFRMVEPVIKPKTNYMLNSFKILFKRLNKIIQPTDPGENQRPSSYPVVGVCI